MVLHTCSRLSAAG